MDVRVPPPLAPGSLVAVVAPAGPFERDELFRGLAWLRLRYRLRVSSNITARQGYLAGADERRAAELAKALTDPEVEAIFCARGGYGSMRLLEQLPWDAFVASPRWIVGFSDITALHVAANARSVATVHAPNVTGLGRSILVPERSALLDALEGRVSADWTGLEVLHAGAGGCAHATGPVLGGNLALVEAMAAAGQLVVPTGAILALEDVTERPYRIDRMLTSLRLGGHLRRVSAVVFGSFTQCEPGLDGISALDVLRERTADLGIPVVSGAPFGHGAPNLAFVLGRTASLEGDVLRWQAASPAEPR